jgi:hypothetical protein
VGCRRGGGERWRYLSARLGGRGGGQAVSDLPGAHHLPVGLLILFQAL